MKLYATITSERATKGQGGNKYLEIDILGDEKNLIGKISIFPADQYNKYGLISYKWLVGTADGYQIRSEGIMEAKDTEAKRDNRDTQKMDYIVSDKVFYCEKCGKKAEIITKEGKTAKAYCKSCRYDYNNPASGTLCPHCGKSPCEDYEPKTKKEKGKQQKGDYYRCFSCGKIIEEPDASFCDDCFKKGKHLE